ncbi:hypothetical protein Tco_0841011 [Tanacetum coccineum]|uniref:Uncharacterized protein n=1 Tax=Tanacetum coccineum TaxID=301880 RepID=A0ABQ5B0V0_9ASTR
MSSSKRQRNVKDPRSPFVYSSKSSFESSSFESSGEADSKQNLVLLKDIEKDEKLSNYLLKHLCALQKRIMKKRELLD